MVKPTPSLTEWFTRNYPNLLGLVMLGHLELFTDDMRRDYLKWCQTEEAKPYLKERIKHDQVL